MSVAKNHIWTKTMLNISFIVSLSFSLKLPHPHSWIWSSCQRWSLATSPYHDGQMARTQAGQTMQFLVTSVPLEESSKFVPSVSKILWIILVIGRISSLHLRLTPEINSNSTLCLSFLSLNHQFSPSFTVPENLPFTLIPTDPLWFFFWLLLSLLFCSEISCCCSHLYFFSFSGILCTSL